MRDKGCAHSSARAGMLKFQQLFHTQQFEQQMNKLPSTITSVHVTACDV